MRVPAYAVNRTKRLMKSPKLNWGDTGLALYLAGHTDPGGAHLENLVLNDLLAWRDARSERVEILHWRSTTGDEVDFVIQADGQLLPIEVKASAACAWPTPGGCVPSAANTEQLAEPVSCCTPERRSAG